MTFVNFKYLSTVRVWRGSECIQELEGHTQAVWAVQPAPDNGILTGILYLEEILKNLNSFLK